ncbi:virulence factor TspB C-terminal domain-related protein [Acinetobacter ursingii]|uniref:virulence factor TspB C-terminal domain-related protein n=1 Tax=Acinetobacter ursingii TaxID=108980 RepID=UPI00313AAE8D
MVNYKKFITLLLIFSVYMMPFNTQAAGFGAWSITNTVAQGASTILTGSKEVILNGAKKIATGTATITPTAAQVSKVLARGAAGYALSVAVEQLLGAVDWVLDPANNQIVYTKPKDENCDLTNCPTSQYKYRIFSSEPYSNSPESACKYTASKMSNPRVTFKTIRKASSGAYSFCVFQDTNGTEYGGAAYALSKVANPAYDPAKEEEKKTLPLETVAQKVISNAASGDAAAQVATTAAAADIVAEAETDNTKARPIINQFENTQTIPTDQTATGESTPTDTTGDPATQVPPSDLTLDFPVFCNWAPTVCLAAQTVISLPQTLINWWDSATTSISESWTWAKSRYESAVTSISEFFSEETNTDTELEFNDPTDDITDTTISFSDQCPAPIILADFNYHGIQQKWEMDFTGWCDVLTTYFKPIAIAMAGFSAVLIVSGVRENG